MKLPRRYPPIWFILFALLILVLDQFLACKVNLGPRIDSIAYAMAATGGLLAFWARLMFLHARTSVHPFQEANQLLTHGAYRISRNPMYLGMLLVLSAMVVWLQNLCGIVIPPLFVVVINRCHILIEEQRLATQFGKSYRRYLKQTRRWI